MKRGLEKYLKVYGEPESILGEKLFQVGEFFSAVALPLCDEISFFPRFVQALKICTDHSLQKTLLIVVVNQNHSSSYEVKENNQVLLNEWSKRLGTDFNESNGVKYFWGTENRLTFLFIDRSSLGFEFEGSYGVGLARKIACDLASAFYFYGKTKSKQVYTTDCDVQLPIDYLKVRIGLPQDYLMIYSFKHIHEKDGSSLQKNFLG